MSASRQSVNRRATFSGRTKTNNKERRTEGHSSSNRSSWIIPKRLQLRNKTFPQRGQRCVLFVLSSFAQQPELQVNNVGDSDATVTTFWQLALIKIMGQSQCIREGKSDQNVEHSFLQLVLLLIKPPSQWLLAMTVKGQRCVPTIRPIKQLQEKCFSSQKSGINYLEVSEELYCCYTSSYCYKVYLYLVTKLKLGVYERLSKVKS